MITNLEKYQNLARRANDLFGITMLSDIHTATFRENALLALESIKICFRTMIHIPHTKTIFSVATILQRDSLEEDWVTLPRVWATLDTKYSDELRINQGSDVKAVGSKQLTSTLEVGLKMSGMKWHKSSGCGKRFHIRSPRYGTSNTGHGLFFFQKSSVL